MGARTRIKTAVRRRRRRGWRARIRPYRVRLLLALLLLTVAFAGVWGAVRPAPERGSVELLWQASHAIQSQEFGEARRIAAESMTMKFPDEPMITKGFLFKAALGVFIPAGDHDRAIELLDEYFAARIGWTIEGVSRDPHLDPIRDHPGWLALVEKYKRQ